MVTVNRQPRRSWGFSVIEMVVVIATITLLVAITFPAMSAMIRSNRRSAAVNTIGAAVAAARAYSVRGIGFAEDLDTSVGAPGDQVSVDGYSGAAALFTPMGEIRLVENDQNAADGSGNKLEIKTPPLNGYRDIDGVDYITLPSGTGVVGIGRNATGSGGLLLLTPPFAIRFNEHGHLIAGNASSTDRLVYYDKDYDGDYTTVGRSSLYDVDGWDPESGEYVDRWNDTNRKYELPLEEIETVIGVLIYSKYAFKDAGLNWGTSTATQINTWLKDTDGANPNSRELLFSRYTGNIAREKHIQ